MDTLNKFKETPEGKAIKGVLTLRNILAIIVVLLLMSTCSHNPAGVNTRVFNPGLGTSWKMEEGYYFKVPLFNSTKSYNQRVTVAVTSNEDTCKAASHCEDPLAEGLEFSDTYRARVEYQMRFQLPLTSENMEDLHQAVKNERNLIGNTLLPFALTLASDTASQVEGTNFAQGGRNQFRTLMQDQADKGMYVTEVKREVVSGSNATDYAKDAKKGDQRVRQVVYVTGEDGERIRKPTSIEAYGISVVANSIQLVYTDPVGKLREYVMDKQTYIARQIEEEESQKFLREKTETERLQGAKALVTQNNNLTKANEKARLDAERERIEEIAKLKLANDRATEVAEREKIEANKVADLAKIEKARLLDNAQKELAIQRAKRKASEQEASVIKNIGFAEAAVEKAKYDAINIEVLRIRSDEKKALAMYESNMKVEMPTYLKIGGDDKTSSSIEDMSSMKLMEQLSVK